MTERDELLHVTVNGREMHFTAAEAARELGTTEDFIRRRCWPESSARAIVRRPTAEDSDCDRCYAPIVAGEIAGYVEPGLRRIPWVAGTVLCSHCSDHLAYKFLGDGE